MKLEREKEKEKERNVKEARVENRTWAVSSNVRNKRGNFLRGRTRALLRIREQQFNIQSCPLDDGSSSFS